MNSPGPLLAGRKGLVSVVVVNYNGARYLDRCITAALAQDYPEVEVIVVDNASSDGSPDNLEERFPGVTLIRNRENLGFAGGTNTGIRASHGEYLFTLNNDAFPEPGCVRHMVAAIEQDPATGMCAAKMLFPDGRINSAGICLSLSGAAWDRGMHQPDTGQFPPGRVFGPCAGAALYRRSMLQETGLFDEDFFLFMEDVDLAFRAMLAGWTCRFVPEASVCHVHGGSAGVGSDIAVYYGNRNILWYPFKDFPLPLLALALPWIFGRTLGVILYYTRRGKGRVIVRSKVDGLLGIRRMIGKRRENIQRMSVMQILRELNVWVDIGSR
jgi:GT2 family glycosyltransferase